MPPFFAILRNQAFVFILFLLTGFNAYSQPRPIKIMPLGNSITQGNMEFVSYRYPLWKKLIDAEVNFEFVGSHTVNRDGATPTFAPHKGQTFSNRNEGHWGWSTDEILAGKNGEGNLSQWLQGYTPDVVLMHLGTNDMFRNQDIEETIGEIKTVISTIAERSPGVTIFIAKLIPAYGQQVGPAIAQKIQALNERIEVLVNDQPANGPPLILVDQNTGFNPTTGIDTYDGVHPNESGMEKMAQLWFDAIVSEIVIPLPVELQSFKAMATQTGVQLNWKTASEQDNAYFEVQRGQSATMFDAIGRVDGAGTTSLPQSYTYQDKEAGTGVVYYRLRQVDFDGTYCYSPVVAVSMLQATTEELRVYPTRSNRNTPITVQLLALQPQEKFSISIYTLEGRLIREFAAEADNRGNFTDILHTTDLNHGSMYMVRATLPNRAFIRHILIDR